MKAIAGPGAGVRPAESAADREAAAEALALAFADDPCWAHLLPEDAGRGEKLLAYYTAEIENLVPEHRELWISEDGSGAAVWARPGRWRVPRRATIRETGQMLGVFGSRVPLGIRTLLRFERHHPKRPEHWYLHYIGVEPRGQGRGLGAALMKPVLDLCDREGTPAYLESSTDRSRLLYERNGFALTEVITMPGRGGPPVRRMWREPPRRSESPAPAQTG